MHGVWRVGKGVREESLGVRRTGRDEDGATEWRAGTDQVLSAGPEEAQESRPLFVREVRRIHVIDEAVENAIHVSRVLASARHQFHDDTSKICVD